MTKKAEPIMLNHRVDLYIPSQCICTGRLPEGLRKEIIDEVKTKFDTWFGGTSESPIMGGWKLPNGEIAKEEIADVFSF